MSVPPVPTLALVLDDEVPTVVVTGDLDLHSVETVDPALFDELDPTSPVVVDLSAAGFVDSIGIGLLVDLARHAGTVHLRNPPRRARRLLELTGLDQLFRYDEPGTA